MRYINETNPNLRVLIARGPEIPRGQNQNVREDRFVEFRFGLAETDDPEAIAILDARPDCMREGEYGKRPGYVREADVEAEIQRRMDVILNGTGALSPMPRPRADDRPVKKSSTNKDLTPITCRECGKEVRGQLALTGHMRTHARQTAGVG